jgi:osmotically-inducible protein OsmY
VGSASQSPIGLGVKARQEAVLRQLWLQDISVRTKDGVVVLTGVVHTIEEKMADGQAAKSVYGARGVANYIAVRP